MYGVGVSIPTDGGQKLVFDVGIITSLVIPDTQLAPPFDPPKNPTLFGIVGKLPEVGFGAGARVSYGPVQFTVGSLASPKATFSQKLSGD